MSNIILINIHYIKIDYHSHITLPCVTKLTLQFIELSIIPFIGIGERHNLLDLSSFGDDRREPTMKRLAENCLR